MKSLKSQKCLRFAVLGLAALVAAPAFASWVRPLWIWLEPWAVEKNTQAATRAIDSAAEPSVIQVLRWL